MKKNILKTAILFFLIGIILSSCKNTQTNNQEKNTKHDSITKIENMLERTKKSNIYEVNIRQYTPEGTFKAFQEKHLDRLHEMGVDILWLMPVQPIGEKNRKGEMGSYYSVKDYIGVNPEFGTEQDFQNLVDAVHERGMLLIIDWVANHSAWDNPWITEHPDWYVKDSTGAIIAPVPDWTDVADLNYDNQDMRNEMIKSLKFWVETYDIDGFRCDVAGMVPTSFWNEARTELNKGRPIFMLAEANDEDLMEMAFDMNYNWDSHHLMNDIAKGEKNAGNMRGYIETPPRHFNENTYRMVFTSNHDENSWNGTVFERMPNSYKTWAVFSFVVPGMPLIYSGQEAMLDRRLKFFDKDEIDWKDYPLQDFYTKLITLKNENKALWNGKFGGEIHFINTSNGEQTITFKRTKDDNTILVEMNLSNREATFNYMEKDVEQTYTEYFTGEKTTRKPHENYTLAPWEYKVLILDK